MVKELPATVAEHVEAATRGAMSHLRQFCDMSRGVAPQPTEGIKRGRGSGSSRFGSALGKPGPHQLRGRVDRREAFPQGGSWSTRPRSGSAC